jgi:adenine phosphoribosyltransferase
MMKPTPALLPAIRVVPGYPKPGIDFYDITTLLKDPEHLRAALDGMSALFAEVPIDQVVGIEARGFFFAPTVAHQLGAGFVPVRKAGKLPARTRRQSYELEYGLAEMEMHEDAVRAPGERFLIVDDVLATGGTARAATRLVEGLGGLVVGFAFMLEIEVLKGREGLPAEVRSLMTV